MNLLQFYESLERLGAMLAQYEHADEFREAVQESLLQRFEYTLEMAWKSAKRYLVGQEGYDKGMGPRTVVRLCRELDLLDAETWLLYLQARQNISHDYSREKAESVLELAGEFYADARRFYSALAAKLPPTETPRP